MANNRRLNRGRPRLFDETEVLQKALDVFWLKGFAATSIEDLVEATGLRKASLYGAFGNKLEIFVSVCRFYRKLPANNCDAAMRQQGQAPAMIKLFFLAEIDLLTSDKLRRGCLMTNTIFGDNLHEPLIAAEWRAFMRSLEAMFRRSLRYCKRNGRVLTATEQARAARYLLTLTQGLMVAVRTGTSNKSLKEVAKIGLQGLGLDPADAAK